MKIWPHQPGVSTPPICQRTIKQSINLRNARSIYHFTDWRLRRRCEEYDSDFTIYKWRFTVDSGRFTGTTFKQGTSTDWQRRNPQIRFQSRIADCQSTNGDTPIVVRGVKWTHPPRIFFVLSSCPELLTVRTLISQWGAGWGVYTDNNWYQINPGIQITTMVDNYNSIHEPTTPVNGPTTWQLRVRVPGLLDDYNL